jgi:hypothetical protein
MNSANLIDPLLALAVVVYFSSRQLTWRPVVTAKMWRLPLALGVIGLLSVTSGSDRHVVNAADVAILVLSGLLAIVSGLLMGRIARFRPIGPAGAAVAGLDRHGRPVPAPTVESRTGWLGVGIWVALIVARILLELLGHRLGADLATSSGVILLALALNRAARTLVISARLEHRSPLSA